MAKKKTDAEIWGSVRKTNQTSGSAKNTSSSAKNTSDSTKRDAEIWSSVRKTSATSGSKNTSSSATSDAKIWDDARNNTGKKDFEYYNSGGALSNKAIFKYNQSKAGLGDSLYARNAGKTIWDTDVVGKMKAAQKYANASNNDYSKSGTYGSQTQRSNDVSRNAVVLGDTDTKAQNMARARMGDKSVLKEYDDPSQKKQRDEMNRLLGLYSNENFQEVSKTSVVKDIIDRHRKYSREQLLDDLTDIRTNNSGFADIGKAIHRLADYTGLGEGEVMEKIRGDGYGEWQQSLLEQYDRNGKTATDYVSEYNRQNNGGEAEYTRAQLAADMETVVNQNALEYDLGDDYVQAVQRLNAYFGGDVEKRAQAEKDKLWQADWLNEYRDTYDANIIEPLTLENYNAWKDALDADEADKAARTQRAQQRAEKLDNWQAGIRSERDYAQLGQWIPQEEWQLEERDGAEAEYLNLDAQMVNAIGAMGQGGDAAKQAAETLAQNDKYAYLLDYGVEYLDDDTRRDFLYLWNSNQHDLALEYLESASYKARQQYNDAMLQRVAETADNGVGGAIQQSLLSIGNNFANQLAAFSTMASSLAGEDIDDQDPRFMFGRKAGTARGVVGEKIAEATPWMPKINGQNLGTLVYNAGTSAADSALNAVTFGGIGAAIMGMGAFNTAYQQNLENDGDPKRAFQDALIDGAIETGTEYFSIEALMSDPTNAFGYFLKNTFTEGAEEVTGDVAKLIADDYFNGEDSQLNQRVRELVRQGYSSSEAKRTALGEWLRETGVDGLVGAMSGAMASAAPTIVSHHQSVNIGRNVRGNEGVESLLNVAKTLDLDKQTKGYVDDLFQQLQQDGYPNRAQETRGTQTEATQQKVQPASQKRSSAAQEALTTAQQRLEQLQQREAVIKAQMTQINAEKDAGQLQGVDTREQVGALGEELQSLAEPMVEAEAAVRDAQAELDAAQAEEGVQEEASEPVEETAEVTAEEPAETQEEAQQTERKIRVSNAKLGYIYRAVMDKLVNASESARQAVNDFMSMNLEQRLSSDPSFEGDAKATASAITDIMRGKVSDAAMKVVGASEAARNLLNEFTARVSNAATTDKQIADLDALNTKPAPKADTKTAEAEESEEAEDGEEEIHAEAPVDAAIDKANMNTADVETIDDDTSMLDDGTEVEIVGMSREAAEDGRTQLVVRTEDGTEQTVATKDILYGTLDSGKAQLAEIAAAHFGKNGDVMFNAYDGSSDVDSYARAFALAAEYGREARNLDVLRQSGRASALTDSQLQTAYLLGKGMQTEENAQRQQQRAARSAKVRTAQVDTSSIDMGSLNTSQRAAVDVASKFAKAVGFNLKVVENIANEAGNFTDENGSWNNDTRMLTLDINAGRLNTQDTQLAVMHTLGHELTHFIRANVDAQSWMDYQSFVMEHLDNQLDLDAEIAKHMQRNADNSSFTRDDAVEEIVSDASGSALSGITEEQLSTLAQRNPSLIRRIGNWIGKWVSNLKRQLAIAFKGSVGRSAAAQQMMDVVDEMSKRWNNLLMQAAWNGRVAEVQEGIAQSEAQFNSSELVEERTNEDVQTETEVETETEEDTEEETTAEESAEEADAETDVLVHTQELSENVGNTYKVKAPENVGGLALNTVHIDERTLGNVVSDVKTLFMDAAPEFKAAYAMAANMLYSDVESTLPGERVVLADHDHIDFGNVPMVVAGSRMTTDTVAMIKDELGWTYAQIKDALQKFIDMGDGKTASVPNSSRMRRLEVIFDDMLTNGYTTIDGDTFIPWGVYIQMKAQYAGTKQQGLLESYTVPKQPASFDDAFALYSEYAQGESSAFQQQAEMEQIEEEDDGEWLDLLPVRDNRATPAYGKGDVKYSPRDFEQADKTAEDGIEEWCKHVETMTDAEYSRTKQSTPLIMVSENTPSILQEYAGAKDRKMLMRLDALYLAIRADGVQEGHYHHLGAANMTDIVHQLSDPDAILMSDAGRCIVLVHVNTKKGQALASVEFETIKDFEGRHEATNLIVTAFDYEKRYLKGQFTKHGAQLVYKKETLAQVNPQLLEWLESFNESASEHTVAQNGEDVKKSSRDISDDTAHTQEAQDFFGVTREYNKAGYLLTNGKMLDFSGKHEGYDAGERTVDHRDIWDVREPSNMDGTQAMIDFMDAGNIRLMPESGGINLQAAPTKAQETMLRGYISHYRGEVIVDIDDESGNTIQSFTYDRGTSGQRVINDLRAYFTDGTLPAPQSGIGQFLDIRFQNRDPDAVSNRELLAEALRGVTQNEKERKGLIAYEKQLAELDRTERALEQEHENIRALKKQGKAGRNELVQAQNRAQILSNRLQRTDGKLMQYEAMEPMRKLAEREREAYRQELQARNKKRLQEYKARVRSETKQKIADNRAKISSKLKADYAAKLEKQRLRTNERVEAARLRGKVRVEAAREAGQRRVDRIHETRDKTHYRQRLQQEVDTMREWITHPTNKAHMPQFLRAPLGNMLDALDFSSKRRLDGKGDTKADQKWLNSLEDMRDVLGKISGQQTSLEGDAATFAGYIDLPVDYMSAFNDLVHDIRTNLEDVSEATQSGDPIGRMNSKQLKQLTKLIGILNRGVRQMNSMLVNARYANAAGAAVDTMDTADKMAAQKSLGKVGDSVRKFVDWTNAVPYYAFQRFGEGGKSIFKALQDGWDKMAFNVNEAIEYANSAYTTAEVKAWSKDTHVVNLSGKDVTFTTAQLMSLYCLSKRAQAVGHLLGGGIRVEDIAGKLGKKIVQADNYTLTEADIQKAVAKLSKRQIQVADVLQSFMNTRCTEWGNEISMKRFGFEAFGEENYFPIETDSNNRKAIDEQAQDNSMFRLLNMSFTKNLQTGANNAVVIRDIFDVFSSHTADMAKYNALALPILDTLKWFNYMEKGEVKKGETSFETRSLRKSLEKAYGKDASQYIRNFIRDLNGVHEGGRNDQLFNKMLSNYKVAAVAANLRVGLLQITSMPRASYAISWKYLAQGVAKNVAFKNSPIAEKKVGIALWKSMGFYDTNVSRNVRELIKHDTSTVDKIKEVSMTPAEKGDAWTMGVLYGAVEAEMRDLHPNIHKGTAQYDAMVNERMREIVYKTQVVDSTMMRSDIMRDTKGKASLMTAFMSEQTLTMNLLSESIYEARMKMRTGAKFMPTRKMGKALAVTTFSVVLSTVFEAIFTAWRDDDEYETRAEKYWTAFKSGIKDNANLLKNYPMLKDAIEALGGNKSENMASVWANTLVGGIEEIYKYCRGESKNPPYNGIYKTLNGASQVSGIPMSGAMRELVSIYNSLFAEPMGWKRVQTYNDSKQKAATAILNAYESGEDKRVEKYEKRAELYGYTGEELQNAYATAIKDQFKADEIDKATAKKLLVQYAGKSEDDAASAVVKYEYEKETGLKFSSMKDDYFAGLVDDAVAKKWIMKENGGDEKKANDKLNKYRYAAATGGELDDLKEDYAAGKVSEAQARKYLQEYGGKSADKADETIDRYDYYEATGDTDGYTKYWRMYDAFENGGDYAQYAQEWLDKGVKKGSIASSIAGRYKEQYLAIKGTPAGDEMLERLLDLYVAIGYNREKERKYINKKWVPSEE